ncbi:MAG: GNAT family N-acetyltransferase [Hafnia sp.]
MDKARAQQWDEALRPKDIEGCEMGVNLEISERALLALQKRLYVPGWGLKGWLEKAACYPELYCVELHYDDGRPVAVLLARHSVIQRGIQRRIKPVKSAEVQVFVRKAYRRQGIGSALIARVAPRLDSMQMRAAKGITGSDHFWRGNSVKPWCCTSRQKPEEWVYL